MILSHVKISMISLISSLSLKLYFEASLDLPQKSLAIFGNLRTSLKIFRYCQKMFGNVHLAFGTILENLWKSLESGQKSSENGQKHRHQCAYIC